VCGASVGSEEEGGIDGETVGLQLGDTVGWVVSGDAVGSEVVGAVVSGDSDGAIVGFGVVGARVPTIGFCEGYAVGETDGKLVDGDSVGFSEGETDG
jgi:hypothetical protein